MSPDQNRIWHRQMFLQLVMSTMQTFDVDKDGYLNFVEFCSMMKASGMEFNGDDDGI